MPPKLSCAGSRGLSLSAMNSPGSCLRRIDTAVNIDERVADLASGNYEQDSRSAQLVGGFNSRNISDDYRSRG
jgi:hypothetical protein